MNVQETLVSALSRAASAVRDATREFTLPAVRLHVPPSSDQGDLSTDLPAYLARAAARPVAEVTQLFLTHLDLPAGLSIAATANPGFVGFTLTDALWEELLRAILTAGSGYGAAQDSTRQRVLLEFVSAQPTGDLTLTHGRAAVQGEAIARLLTLQGHQVSREFYVNDADIHVERFVRSVEAVLAARRGERSRRPVDGYEGPLVEWAADAAITSNGAGTNGGGHDSSLRDVVTAAIVGRQRALLQSLGIQFEAWVSERTVVGEGLFEEALHRLRDGGHVREQDGAVWLATPTLGDSQDRALIRSNGQPTYLAGDLAYHFGKRRRGYDLLLDLWAADHAPYAQRTRSGMRALGVPEEALEIRVFQPVILKRDGVALDTGNRAGNIPLLEDVLEEIGSDAFRYQCLATPSNTLVELDLDAAPEATGLSALASILAARTRAADAGAHGEREVDHPAQTPGARALLARLAAWPADAAQAAREREPHRVVRYLSGLAHAYTVIEAERRRADSAAPCPRGLDAATAAVMDAGLHVLGIAGR